MARDNRKETSEDEGDEEQINEIEFQDKMVSHKGA